MRIVYSVYIYIYLCCQMIQSQLITSKIKRFFYIIYVCTVYIYYVYINTHTCMYIFQKKMIRYVYILNIFIYNKLHEYKCINVNIFQIYTVCVCIYIYIINIHNTHKYLVILDVINRLCCQKLLIRYI